MGAAFFAVANWFFDATCLWTCLWAYGDRASPGLVLTAYGFASLLGHLPLTPGGLGIVEGTLIPPAGRVRGGRPRRSAGHAHVAAVPVLAARPAGGLCYLGLKLTGRLDPHRIAVDDPPPRQGRVRVPSYAVRKA